MARVPARAGCRPAALQRGRGRASRHGGRAGGRVRHGEGRTAAANSTLLPAAFLGSTASRSGSAPARTAVRLPEQSLEAWRYTRSAPGGRRSRADRLHGPDLRWGRDGGLRGAGRQGGIARSAVRRHRRDPSAEEGDRLSGGPERHVRDRAQRHDRRAFSRPLSPRRAEPAGRTDPRRSGGGRERRWRARTTTAAAQLAALRAEPGGQDGKRRAGRGAPAAAAAYRKAARAATAGDAGRVPHRKRRDSRRDGAGQLRAGRRRLPPGTSRWLRAGARATPRAAVRAPRAATRARSSGDSGASSPGTTGSDVGDSRSDDPSDDSADP